MFISIHPDDETLGCGGTILKHKAAGDIVYWLNLTGPTPDHPLKFPQEIIEIRERQIKDVCEAYQFDRMINLEHPTQMLDAVEPRLLIGSIAAAFRELEPEILYIPNRSDIHSDHKVGFQAIFSAAKSFRNPFIRKIMMYETLSETEFSPALAENVFIANVFCDISPYMEEKLRIMQMYDTETMPDPLPRSNHAMLGLASYRGARIGVRYAEAFSLLLEIDN